MKAKEILQQLGKFTDEEVNLFAATVRQRTIGKNEIVLHEGEVCRAFFFILSGSFFQFFVKDIDDVVVDLHTSQEWVYNHDSLIAQEASQYTIKAFHDSEILELKLTGFHKLVSISDAFLQLNRILDQPRNRTFIFDNSLTPDEKYDYICKVKPLLPGTFPVKMIASYLKIAPETLSRVRGRI